ncbi:DUF4351 domain-containing protein [Saccharospirillum impatiens]|uniref:DUF4351 domain-containing protein n=1 Tax=Saccharospirillum impatiens TaxID=169438 RepID=UPI000420525B|nr:DUF4351 domain-containing protein [Saccharospirillum impatiens]
MEGSRRVSHDQNFKNLIIDYPLQAIQLFSPEEAGHLGPETRVVPLRQEQLKERLGERFRELDVPLMVEWPNGQREALLFVLEEETDPGRFSIHRLAHYCLDLADLCQTTRVVPVVIFLNSLGKEPTELTLGGDRHDYLQFQYIRCALAEWEAEKYWDSNNLIARLCLSLMHWSADQKLKMYAKAVQGLVTLEPNPEKQLKYLDFIDIYSELDDNEQVQYKAEYPQEDQTMASLTERLKAEGMEQGRVQGMEQGRAQGMEQGERAVISRLLQRRFGSLDAQTLARLEAANQNQLELWAERILDAGSLAEVFREH